MSRKRLSWITKTADPYEMNQDHDQPGHDEYLIGDPSAFAEEPMEGFPEEGERNEVGLPSPSDWDLTHKDVEEWDSDAPYDNADTFDAEDRDREASLDRRSARDVYARLEKKAYQCCKIASSLLPDADEEIVEEQAFDLMSLPDEAVISTMLRITEEEEGEEMEEEEMDEEKESSDEKDVEAMLNEMLEKEDEVAIAEDDEDEEEEKEEEMEMEEDEEKESMPADDEVESMIDEMMEEGEQVADATQEEQPAQEPPQAQDLDLQNQPDQPQLGMGQGQSGMDFDLANDQSIDADKTDFDVEMEPTMDVVDANDIQEDDEVLQSIFSESVPEEAKEGNEVSAPVKEEQQTREASQSDPREGVQTLGRVKEASDQGGDDSDLSKLWETDPDVSDIFQT